MKVFVCVCCLLFSQICFAYNDEFEPYFFRNNFNDDIHENTSFFKLFGLDNRFRDVRIEVLKDLNTCHYKGKSLEYILKDLSKKYKFLDGMAFNGVLGLDQIDFSYRTHFIFTLKFNDSLSLGVVGMLAKSERFYEESDSTAFNRILDIDKYILLPTIQNMRDTYHSIIERMKANNSPMLKEQLDEILRDFPKVAK
ncbi:MAG: hypothetical protein KIT33_13565 [Candidatus Kapabacteria bacterium]|nr:hypothetical protein [Ignavibacteriota bacterium]MCW5885993.1 hypothetical protein [Candidatus Kapabacteria bacterium]